MISKIAKINYIFFDFLYLFIIIKIIQQYYQKNAKNYSRSNKFVFNIIILSCFGITIYHQN